MNTEELKQLLFAVIEEEFTPNPVPLAKRWAGGKIVLQPDNDTQAKEIPLEVFFRKVVGVREALRVLEQKINNHDSLTPEDKATFAGYVTKCYGSLTTFNILFKEDKHKFVGAGSGSVSTDGGESTEPKMSVGQAKKKLGLNEY